ncbi:hypothetical protein EYZ11_004496 [Aspergillus tanneri]|uniref:Cutinase n=1 Tax=Aspergillus tanneri TaxID=1220188 RepID=A0A4S3JKH3_9EURO|nr:hypothetical protein EYZ11_004496 [Aspergillus tanneri]
MHLLIPPLPFLISALAAQDPCPAGPHIITVRETSASPNEGLVRQLADLAQYALPGSDIHDIEYPATAIGPIYFTSEAEGVKNTTLAIKSFTSQCPKTDIVLLGYSQGAQVVGDVLCGTSELLFSKTDPLPWEFGKQVKAAILMGDVSHVPDAPYAVGNSTNEGVCRIIRITYTSDM